MVYEYRDYRSFLKNVFAHKSANTPRYSLRMMAKHIGLSPSTLSEVMAGKKNLSAESAMKVSHWLKLGAKEFEYLSTLVQIETLKSESMKIQLMKKLESLAPAKQKSNIDLERFRLISEWYHFAILDLLNLEKFNYTPKNIAQQLGLTHAQVEMALDRLVRLELLEKDQAGRYRRRVNGVWVEAQKPNEAIRHYHRQMLNKAIEALETQTPQEKIVGTENMAFDQKNLEQANQVIEDCFTKLLELSKKTKAKNALYHLGIQFFKLTKGSQS